MSCLPKQDISYKYLAEDRAEFHAKCVENVFPILWISYMYETQIFFVQCIRFCKMSLAKRQQQVTSDQSSWTTSHEICEVLFSITIPEPKGIPPTVCLGTLYLYKKNCKMAEPPRCLSLEDWGWSVHDCTWLWMYQTRYCDMPIVVLIHFLDRHHAAYSNT